MAGAVELLNVLRRESDIRLGIMYSVTFAFPTVCSLDFSRWLAAPLYTSAVHLP